MLYNSVTMALAIKILLNLESEERNNTLKPWDARIVARLLAEQLECIKFLWYKIQLGSDP